MIDITLDFDKQDYANMVGALGIADERIHAAAYRTVYKTAKWVNTQFSRALSKETKVAAKFFKKRLRIYRDDPRALKAKVWMGLFKIRASMLGNPQQTRAGVTVGRHRFPGSFVATMPSGHKGVFKRRGKARLKIDEQQLDISEQASKVYREMDLKIEDRFLVLMEQEVNYEINKVMKSVN